MLSRPSSSSSDGAAHARRLTRRTAATIAAAGAVGALTRYGVGLWFPAQSGTFPWATLAINLTGSAFIGFVMVLLVKRFSLAHWGRPLLVTGFCGAYTTFSTMQVEILRLIDRDRYGLAAAYACASLAGGYLAIWVATALVRRTRLLA